MGRFEAFTEDDIPLLAMVVTVREEDEDQFVAGAGAKYPGRGPGTSVGENEDQATADAGVKSSARSPGTSAGKISHSPVEGPSPDSERPKL